MDGETPYWVGAGWLSEAEQWITDALGVQGIALAGAIEKTQLRPWSIVLRAPTAEGYVYYKETPPVLAHEVALTAALAEWVSGAVPPVLAIDPVRHRLLTRDGGAPIRERVRAEGNARAWYEPLRRYANLQIELTHHVLEMLKLGVPDRRPAALPAQYDALLDDTAILCLDRPDGLTSAELERLRVLSTLFADECAQLAARSIPPSLHHGDLNNGNVLGHDTHWTFTDWGDCSVAHPFCSIRTVLVSNKIVFGLPDNDLRLAPLRDVYLSCWGGYGSDETLRATFRLAQHIASITGALGWHRVVSSLPLDSRQPYRVPVPALLKEYLYANLDEYPFA